MLISDLPRVCQRIEDKMQEGLLVIQFIVKHIQFFQVIPQRHEGKQQSGQKTEAAPKDDPVETLSILLPDQNVSEGDADGDVYIADQ